MDDCGPRISPLLVEGQIHGGLAQGIGQALLEEIVFDDQGQLLTGSMMDYAMPRADNFPPLHDQQDGDGDHAESAGREGHRRGGDYRIDSGGGQRGG